MPTLKDRVKKRRLKIKVDNFMVNRISGESFEWKRLDIKKKDIEALNEIGHTGKFKDKKMTIQEYFDRKIDGNGIKHKIEIWTSNNMEFTDKLLVTRVNVK